MNYDEVMGKLKALASHDPKDLAGMARFGINVDKAWVISIPKLRALAKEIKKYVTLSGAKGPGLDPSCGQDDKGVGWVPDHRPGMTREELHELALEVWKSGIHEVRILAGFIDEPKLVTEKQMEKWALDFDSWDVTDMICGNLFDATEYAVLKAKEWSARPEEFVKRAGFVLMCGLGVHNKTMPDEVFLDFLDIIRRESTDERNFVRKAVNWALRTIGKSRNENLYLESLKLSRKLYKSENKTARWIGSDATRELEKDYIKKRFM